MLPNILEIALGYAEVFSHAFAHVLDQGGVLGAAFQDELLLAFELLHVQGDACAYFVQLALLL